jgi:sugar/nucleoside kinase (ribokinase family)
VIVAGHICLDIIPAIHSKKDGLGSLLIPGKLLEVGQAVTATGGAVSNTGLALHQLGKDVKLLGKIGADLFGDAVLTVLRGYAEHLAEGMIVSEHAHTSYSIVISPPNVDRIFLHCTGANDTFSAADIQNRELAGAKLFHFGYPPLMRNMYMKGGVELEALLKKVKEAGITVSLDMAKPDPESDAGMMDWRNILQKTLPYVDIFLPSFEEIVYMLNRDLYNRLVMEAGGESFLDLADGELLSAISEELLGMGAAVVGMKLGEHGMYVRTSPEAGRHASMGALTPTGIQRESWANRELLCPAFEVAMAGTTGAGDCTIAGFLAGMLEHKPLEETLLGAVGVGGCNVEQADATSGIIPMEQVRQRIRNGWRMRESKLVLLGWERDGSGLYRKGTGTDGTS